MHLRVAPKIGHPSSRYKCSILTVLTQQHSAELSSARRIADDQTKELRGLYDYLVSLRERQRDAEGRRHFEHPALVQEVRKEIDGFKAQVCIIS